MSNKMKKVFILLGVLCCMALTQICFAQYPGMRTEDWYKEKVLKSDDPNAVVEEVAEETEGILSQMQKAQTAKKWKDIIALYPEAKKEYARNRNVYAYARVAARNIVGETQAPSDLEMLESIYADYYAAGNSQESFNYTGRDNGQQWNDMQQMLDYARFSQKVDFDTRYARVMEFVNRVGEEADPWIIYNGVLVPLSSQFSANITTIRKDNAQSDKYYKLLSEVHDWLVKQDAYVKEHSSNYDIYAMDVKIDACEKNRMLVIPFADYQKLHPMSEIEEHKNDELYLSKLSEELSRWPNENMTKVVNNYYNNIGASFAKFKSQGDKYTRSGNYRDAVAAYERAIELAENDVQRYDGYIGIATAHLVAKSYNSANVTVQKAIALIGNRISGYNLRYQILRQSSNTINGKDNFYNTLDRNILAGEMISVLTKGLAMCDEEDNPDEYEKANKNMADARNYASRCCPENSQLFMHGGLQYNTTYHMQSGDIKLSGTLRKY